MNTPGIVPSAFANFVTPFHPVGKQAVGLENSEAKEEPLAPVEEGAEPAAAFNDQENEQAVEERREQQEQSAEQLADEQADDGRVEQAREREQQQLDLREIRQLASRDREVRAHEQAHSAVGGQYAGSPSFQFARGPDGVNYAVSGEVAISVPSSSDNPELTIAAAEQVRRAALAPADPSPQDHRIAADSLRLIETGHTELAQQERMQVREDREAGQEERDTQMQLDEQRQQEQRLQADREEAQRQRQLEQQSAAARRTSQLGDRLITLDNIQSEQQIGAVVDKQA